MKEIDGIKDLKKSAKSFIALLGEGCDLHAFHSNSQSLIGHLIFLLENLDTIGETVEEGEDFASLQVLRFDWSTDVLDLSILLRDAELELSKKLIDLESQASIVLGSRVEEDKRSHLSVAQKNMISGAIQETISTFDTILSTSSVIEDKWFHQKSPIQVILSQLENVKIQKVSIVENYLIIERVIPLFNDYRDHLIDYTNNRIQRLREVEALVDEVGELVDSSPNQLDKVGLSSLCKSIEKLSVKIENAKVKQYDHIPFLAHSSDLKIPILTDGAEMVYRQVNFDRNVESWTESEILPKIIDVDSDINTLYDKSSIILFNTKNKIENLALGDQDVFDFDGNHYALGIRRMEAELEAYKSVLDKDIFDLNMRTTNELHIENLYDPNRVFLPELSFINMTKLTGQRIWYETHFWNEGKAKIKKFLSSRKIPFLSHLGTNVYSFLESRKTDYDEIENNSLFLKKGYLGRSFFMERTEPESKILSAIERWKDGYQGSILVVGDYGSGKTSLLEYMPHFLTDVKVVSISLNHSLSIKGRKHLVGKDIQESINFLAKQSISNHIVACIDDLELWQHGTATMYSTIREITDGIAKYGKRIFFIVSVNHFMLAHIEGMFDFESRFCEVLNLDSMEPKSVTDALIVRHNACIKDYREDDTENVTQKANRIARKNSFNIGASMLSWERYLEKNDLIHESIPPSFFELVKKHDLLLKIILANRRIKESQLRHYLTNSDNTFISEEIRKMMGFKLINRTFDGCLEVNSDIISDVEYCLKNPKKN